VRLNTWNIGDMSRQYTSSVIDPLLGSIPAFWLLFKLDAGAKDRVNAGDGWHIFQRLA